MAPLGDKDIGRLDVTVHDAFGVRRIEPICDLDCRHQQVFDLHGLPGDAVLQGYTLEILHGDKALAFMFADFVNGADVGVVQGRGGARFPAEAFQRLGVSGYIIGQKLECDEAAKGGVLGFVNHTHAAATQFFDDAVMRDSLAQQTGKASPFGAHVICPVTASQRLSKALRCSGGYADVLTVSDSIRPNCQPESSCTGPR